MEKISTIDLVTWELESYLDGILTCCDFDNDSIEQYVTGEALELLKRLPECERAYAIGSALAAPDYDCINCFPYPRGDNEFFLPPTEFEIDITDMKLESPEDFYIQKTGDCKLAYYAMEYGAFIALDLDKLADYVSNYLADQAAGENE